MTRRFKQRAILALLAAGAIGAFGACKDKGITPPPPPSPPPPPPPPPGLAAPTNLTATPVSATKINLTWTDNSTTETGFKLERCSGAACTSFAMVTTTAANVAAYPDSNLTAGTSYSYRARAVTATDSSALSNVATATTLAATGFVMVGAGEITSCASTASNLTAALVDSVLAKNANAIVYTVGNNLSDAGANASFQNCFEPRWGRFKANPNFRVALGQRDFEVGTPPGGTEAVYAYFGDKAGAPNGWYAFDIGTTWRVIVLNSATWQHGQTNLTDPTSAQNTWLANDLATNQRKCTLAIFNTRRFYSYGSMENGNGKTVWRILHTAGAEVMLSATDKYYERWAPQNHDMGRDDAGGIRQFIVGTGGRTLDNFAEWKPIAEVPNLEVRDASVHGVLKLTLNADSYDWEFMPTVAGGFTDKGTTACH